ncbi:phosphatidylserine decarboxylase [Chryseomicrobium palamuruense]|uniref:phosphatidylserine decarboxylase n=1 Tax=Chryseomicrobium palamuruense TaxID=682973 RepID=A0ABV8UXP0_9BACL
MKKFVYQQLIELTNTKWTSGALKQFAQSRISRHLISSYKKTFQIDTNGALKNQSDYKSLHDFFIREYDRTKNVLVPATTETVISPVDAKVESMGELTPEGEFMVKGQAYSVRRLLARADHAEDFYGGEYVVLYLSPADYHRIHSPVDGVVYEHYLSGGRSYPVNQLGLLYGKKPLSDNYRVVNLVKSHGKKLAVIKVGAMFVNSIEMTVTNDTWRKGQEVGYFGFGSTVVLLFEKGAIKWRDTCQVGRKVQVGEPLCDMLY